MTNASNTARSIPIGRPELISEAGEVFTPLHIVDKILDEPSVLKVLQDQDASILEPSAGDGNFVVGIIERRIDQSKSFTDNLDSLSKIWAIEIQEDNLQVLKDRVKVIVCRMIDVEDEHELDLWLDSNFLCGSFVTGRSCTLSCKIDCTEHHTLNCPAVFDLIVGNPPYNPNNLYMRFVERSLRISSMSVMILPTSWKISDRYKKFRSRIAPYAAHWVELPWSTFAIKPRTGILTLTQKPKILRLQAPNFRIEDSILSKAYAAWPTTLKNSQGQVELYIGWKCNLKKDGNRINMLQSLDYHRDSDLLPNNLFSLSFASEEIRRSWILWSTTKLAAYLQQLTDSDTVCRELPFPINLVDGFSEDALYDSLGLTTAERASIISCELYISGKAAEFYQRESVTIRSDAVVGQVRKSCVECGSSSFHKKGCSNSTLKEISIRDA